MKIQTGEPKEPGLYVAYTRLNDDLKFPYPEKKLLSWHGRKWGYPMSDQIYRAQVFGWIGPLPCPKISDLIPKEKCDCCDGTGVNVDTDGNEGSCFNCLGRGFF